VKIFQTYGKPVLILATDIAQSLVIPNVDCIIDSGLQTKLELVNAVERLVKKHLPKTAIQRRSSKAGRTKEGAYVLCSDVPYEELPDYGEPEIYEKCIDKLTLAIATSGLESLNLHFFHPLDPVLLQESKKMLVTIGALDSEGAITELGRQLRLFPTSVMLGRMILEGVKRKCLTRVLTFAAILSTVKRSIKLTRSKNRDYPEFVKEWSEAVPSDKQYDSDLLAEYDLWEFGYQDITTLQHHGIERKSYLEAVDIRQKLVFLLHKMGYHTGPEYNEYANDDSEVLKCIAAGMIYHVYRYGGQKNKYVGRDVRFLSKESLINRGDYPQLIVGIPYDIPVPKKSEEGTAIIPILTHCTAIDPAWLSELAPELMQTVEYPAGWNYEKLMLTQETVTYFNEVEIMRVSTPVKYSEQNLVILANYMSRAFLPGDDLRTSWIEKLRQEFFDKKLGDTFAFAKEFIRHTEDYQTVVLSELSRHKGSIRGLILGLLERGVRKFDDLPAVENDNYISVINDFVIKKRGTMRFDFQEKPIGKQIMRFATCYVSLNGTEYALEGEFASTHKIAKRNAAKVMYQKLAEMKDEILLPAGSIKPKPLQVVSKNVWELPEVKNDDYTLAIRFFADKYTAVVSYRLIGGYSKGYKATSVCRLAFKGMAYEEKGNTAPNNFSAKQSAAKKMYEKLSGIIVESLSLVS
ncbi:MAG: hypothetical protein JWM20_293, partial [Patescibacteria group bacterium]|nr:hypothetical protein [Patescibacteria group bacterium]